MGQGIIRSSRCHWANTYNIDVDHKGLKAYRQAGLVLERERALVVDVTPAGGNQTVKNRR